MQECTFVKFHVIVSGEVVWRLWLVCKVEVNWRRWMQVWREPDIGRNEKTVFKVCKRVTFISVSPNLQEGLDPSPPSPPRGQAASLRKPPTKEPRTACIKTATNPPLGNYEPLHLGLETGRLNVNSALMVHIRPYELREIPTHSPIQCCLETNSVKGNVFSRSW